MSDPKEAMALYGIWSTGEGKWQHLGSKCIAERFTKRIGVVLAIYYDIRVHYEKRIKDDGSDCWQKTWDDLGYQVRRLGEDGRPAGEVLNE